MQKLLSQRLKWCHEPVRPAVSERPARKALRQLTVLVVGLRCLFSLRLISHGWPEICRRQKKQIETPQLGANVWKSGSLSYREKQMISRRYLWIRYQQFSSLCFICVSAVVHSGEMREADYVIKRYHFNACVKFSYWNRILLIAHPPPACLSLRYTACGIRTPH